MPLLKITPTTTATTYTDPRASILTGTGNKNISSTTIQNYFKRPNVDPKKALADMLKYNVSFDQLSVVPGLQDKNKLQSFAEKQGISFDHTNPEPITYEIPEVKAQQSNYVAAQQDPVKGTVSGQLDQILSNPNSPLLKRANYLGTTDANRRGLGNSSIATEAGLASMTDAGLQIATPDAAANNTFALSNADTQNRVNMFNSDQVNRVGMFNSGTAADIVKNRESLSAGILNNRESLANNLATANLDTNTKLAVADLQARSEDSKFAASLYDTLLKLQENINSNPDMTPDDKARYFGDLVKTLTSGVNLLDTFASADLGDLNFGSSQQSSGSTNNTSQNTANNNQQSVSILPDGDSSPITNINGRIIDGFQKNSIQNFNANRGTKFDPRYLVAPEEMEGMTFQQKSEKFIPLPNYDAKGNLKQDTAFFHKP